MWAQIIILSPQSPGWDSWAGREPPAVHILVGGRLGSSPLRCRTSPWLLQPGYHKGGLEHLPQDCPQNANGPHGPAAPPHSRVPGDLE